MAVRRCLLFASVFTVAPAPWISNGSVVGYDERARRAAAHARSLLLQRRAQENETSAGDDVVIPEIGMSNTSQGLDSPPLAEEANASIASDSPPLPEDNAASSSAGNRLSLSEYNATSGLTSWRWGAVGAPCSEVCEHGCTESAWPMSREEFDVIVRATGMPCAVVSSGSDSWSVNPGRDERTHQCWWYSQAPWTKFGLAERCDEKPVSYRRVCPCQIVSKKVIPRSRSAPLEARGFEEVTRIVATAGSEAHGREAVHTEGDSGLDSDGRNQDSGLWGNAGDYNSTSWPQVDLGREVAIGAMTVWNHHSSAPPNHCRGLRTFSAQAYVNDSWITLATHIPFPEAREAEPGDKEEEPAFGHSYKAWNSALPSPYDKGTSEIVGWLPVTTRILRLTDFKHYGETTWDSCYSQSEIKIFRLSERHHPPREVEELRTLHELQHHEASVDEQISTTEESTAQEDTTRSEEQPLTKSSPDTSGNDTADDELLDSEPVFVDDEATPVFVDDQAAEEKRRVASALDPEKEGGRTSDAWKSRWHQARVRATTGEATRSISLVLFGLMCMAIALGALRQQLWSISNSQAALLLPTTVNTSGDPEAVREEIYTATEAEQKVDAEDPQSELECVPKPRSTKSFGGGIRNIFSARKFSGSTRTPRGYTKAVK